MVARLVRDQEAMGSNPVTSTNIGLANSKSFLLVCVTGQFEITYHSLSLAPLRYAWTKQCGKYITKMPTQNCVAFIPKLLHND